MTPNLSSHKLPLYTLKTESRYDANFIGTDSTAGFHNDNLQYHQWQ